MSPLYFPGNRTKIKRRTISNFIGATDNGKKIIFSYRTNAVAIIVDYSKSDVKDLWDKGIIYCHGQGRYKNKNDMEQVSIEDKLLYHSRTNGMEIHLFMEEEPNEFRYYGVLSLADNPYQESVEDEDGKEWYEWVFPMVLVRGINFKIPERYKRHSSSTTTVLKACNPRMLLGVDEKIKEIMKGTIKKVGEEYCDYIMQQEIRELDRFSNDFEFQYNATPKMKQEPKFVDGNKVFMRDKQTAINALAHACYECEIDSTHPSFIRKNSDKKYTEPHHLVPMAFSELFEVSLDVEENIVSLCSNCHNQIHYGRDAKELLIKLYEERKELLASVGIVITIEQLLAMYGIYN